MNLERINARAAHDHLSVFGTFHPQSDDGAPSGCKTLVLLGPEEPGFWPAMCQSPHFTGADPVDNWSLKIIGAIAHSLNAEPLFPFGGPPYQPFVNWALKTNQTWVSEVGLLIHEKAGLFASFRGALAFRETLDLPRVNSTSPCETCKEKPCLTACPVGAISPRGYDVPACHDYLDGAGEKTCMQQGCSVRRSCPASQNYGRLEVQSAHHMRYFHKKADP